MTRPMSEEERKEALVLAKARLYAAEELNAMVAPWTDLQEISRALLSTSSAEREALELVRISNGWRYMADETKAIVIAALSGIEPGEG